MMCLVLLYFLFLVYSEDKVLTDIEMFEQWKAKYTVSYLTVEEHEKRLNVWKKNVKISKELSEKNEHAEFGDSPFMDLTQEEFASRYLTTIKFNDDLNRVNQIEASLDCTPPTKFDWRDESLVTTAKSQGQCGSCWAFAVTVSTEYKYAIETGYLKDLSEQMLVDCDTENWGCSGGYFTSAMQYVVDNGQMLEEDYTYQGTDGTCRYDSTEAKREFNSYDYREYPSAQDIKCGTVAHGPTAGALDASSLQYYYSGILSPGGCGGDLNHAVSIVGYDDTGVLPYYIVKNSWGSNWGDNGYFKIQSGIDSCGIEIWAFWITS